MDIHNLTEQLKKEIVLGIYFGDYTFSNSEKNGVFTRSTIIINEQELIISTSDNAVIFHNLEMISDLLDEDEKTKICLELNSNVLHT